MIVIATTGPLTFKYTNTQKLRLSKTNPAYLREIELKEASANRLRGKGM